MILTGLVGGEHAPGKASGTKKTKHGQLHPLSRVKELTNYTREWLSDNLVSKPVEFFFGKIIDLS